jgi:hypothetical protein
MAVEALVDAGDLALLAAVRRHASADRVDLATCVVRTLERYTS